VARDTIATNFTGPMTLTDALLPELAEGARIVNVSSGVADRSRLSKSIREALEDPSLTRAGLAALMQKFVDDVAAGRHGDEGWPSSAYCVSKIGLNRLTELYGAELAGDPRRILANAACPGWVRTDMGGPGAPLSPEEGAVTPVWLALLPAGGPSGGFFRDRAPASW
jgi:NAD(P)-dependent dehydrogenase (short-subunit alcohol dehydrogenase family)